MFGLILLYRTYLTYQIKEERSARNNPMLHTDADLSFDDPGTRLQCVETHGNFSDDSCRDP